MNMYFLFCCYRHSTLLILYSLTFLFLKVNETQFKVIQFGWLILPSNKQHTQNLKKKRELSQYTLCLQFEFVKSFVIQYKIYYTKALKK